MQSVKERVATMLRQKRGEFVSGEEIAKELGVSRAAVWKNIKSLKNSGFNVASVTNRGYCFIDSEDIIAVDGIKEFLDKDLKDKICVEVTGKTTSTNDILKSRAAQGEKEFTLLVAGEQTKGKGRMGRTFFSPGDTGVYLSLLLKPAIKPADAVLITTAAAVSVCEALEKCGAPTPKIKWVNDIFVEDKKVCGILTEASFNIENGTLDYAVLGIGVNMYEPEGGFPDDINNIAGWVFSEKRDDLRNRFVACFINSFISYYENLENKKHCAEYERRCFVVGKNINVISSGSVRPAVALGVDENCGLAVRFENGETAVLNSGEISIRVKN